MSIDNLKNFYLFYFEVNPTFILKGSQYPWFFLSLLVGGKPFTLPLKALPNPLGFLHILLLKVTLNTT